jgi:hypothetical protein
VTDYEWTDEKLAACWAAFHAERARQFGENPAPPEPKVLYNGEGVTYQYRIGTKAYLLVDGDLLIYPGTRVHIIVTEVTGD